MVALFPLIGLLVFVGLVALGLTGILKIRNQAFHEKAHLAVSFLPWVHLIASYAVAFYVRIGFGAWPRSCIDSPDLPLIGGLTAAVALGVFALLLLVFPVWLGWLIIRLRQRAKSYWVTATAVFLSGMITEVVLQRLDPWKFWSWVWD